MRLQCSLFAACSRGTDRRLTKLGIGAMHSSWIHTSRVPTTTQYVHTTTHQSTSHQRPNDNLRLQLHLTDRTLGVQQTPRLRPRYEAVSGSAERGQHSAEPPASRARSVLLVGGAQMERFLTEGITLRARRGAPASRAHPVLLVINRNAESTSQSPPASWVCLVLQVSASRR